jgi:hypothetical protein
MRKFSLLIAILGVCLVSPVFAHDGSYDFGTLTLNDVLNVQHDDQDTGNGYKGTFTVSGTNTGTEAWGDFHFAITGFMNVYFTTGGGVYPKMNGVTMDPEDYVIGTNGGGYSTIDLFFYDDPVVQNEFVTFTVYTDNTAAQNSFFGICLYPTPVPEPMTLAMLGLGSLGLLIRRK